jgi:AraC-like DNA-binding protein
VGRGLVEPGGLVGMTYLLEAAEIAARCAFDLSGRQAPSTTVAAIARRWGFADPTHFSRVFRAAYGMSPREWRASHRRQPRGR